MDEKCNTYIVTDLFTALPGNSSVNSPTNIRGNNGIKVFSMWSAPRNSRLLLLGNGAVNIPSQ
jgi:hypothetical protein